MNQILSVEMNTNNTKKSKKQKTSSTIDIKKILIFFGIALIVIGLAFTIMNSINVSSDLNKNAGVEQTKADIVFENEPEDDETKITINHDKPITKLTYNWNGLEEINVSTYNRTSIVQTIPIPDGTNILTIKVTDEIGSVTTIEKTFTKVQAEIKFSFTVSGKVLKIKAEDNTEMENITYLWNSDNSTKQVINVASDAENKKVIETEIEIPKGQNTLTVIATNKKGQSKTKTQEFEGVEIPKVQIQQDGNYLIITATDDNGIKLIEYTLNQQKYRIDLTTHDITYWNAIEGLTVTANSLGEFVKVEYRQLMNDKGENIIKLSVENKKNAIATFTGRCNNL